MLMTKLRAWHTHLAAQTRRQAACDARRAAQTYANPADAKRLRFAADVLNVRRAAQDHALCRKLDAAFERTTSPQTQTASPAPLTLKTSAALAGCLVATAVRQVVDWAACVVGAVAGAVGWVAPVDHWGRFRAYAEANTPEAFANPTSRRPGVSQNEAVVLSPSSPWAAKICLVTQYTANTAPYAEIAVANQRTFAEQHGYGYAGFTGRISGWDFIAPHRGSLDDRVGGGLYWQKITALEKTLACTDAAGQAKYDWAMWVDSDIVFTNPHNTVEAIIEKYAPAGGNKHVILSREQAGRQDVPINAGAIFVKNSEAGRQFLRDIAGRYSAYESHEMPEQDAITDYAFGLAESSKRERWDVLRTRVHPHVAIAPQRTFNSFVRSHRVDRVPARWQPGDFVAHVSYGPVANRVERMRDVLATVASCRRPAPLPAA